MLEVLYACGLRVSELLNLKLELINLKQGYLRITGKGNKERLVPLGQFATEWVERYLRESLIGRIAPVSPQMVLCFIAERALGLLQQRITAYGA